MDKKKDEVIMKRNAFIYNNTDGLKPRSLLMNEQEKCS